MSIQVPIGLIDDFRRLRELGLEYVDKSHLIQELLDRPGTEVVLLPARGASARRSTSPCCAVSSSSAHQISPLFQ